MQIKYRSAVLPQTDFANICLKCQREFYMVETLCARICVDAGLLRMKF